MIAIIDYGMGNLRSVEKAFRRLNTPVEITSNANDIAVAKKLVLPGVGNFKSGMKNLSELGLIDVLNKRVLEEKIPILGICLGMQLFTNHSEEGDCDGLQWIDATTRKFMFGKNVKTKVPHIGWNSVKVNKSIPLFNQIDTDESFYFVHSYFVSCNDTDNKVAVTEYGITFDSSIARQHIVGVQFHPEKSHDEGIKMLKNFIEFY